MLFKGKFLGPICLKIKINVKDAFSDALGLSIDSGGRQALRAS
jgi:hypothetical protein